MGVIELKNRWFVFKRLIYSGEDSSADLLIQNELDFDALENIESKDDVFFLVFKLTDTDIVSQPSKSPSK